MLRIIISDPVIGLLIWGCGEVIFARGDTVSERAWLFSVMVICVKSRQQPRWILCDALHAV